MLYWFYKSWTKRSWWFCFGKAIWKKKPSKLLFPSQVFFILCIALRVWYCLQTIKSIVLNCISYVSNDISFNIAICPISLSSIGVHSMIKTWIASVLPSFLMNFFTNFQKVWQMKHVLLFIRQNKINFSFSKSCVISPHFLRSKYGVLCTVII